MSVLPEFDTYQILPKFARRPNKANLLALHWLKIRVHNKVLFDIMQTSDTRAKFDSLLDFRLGYDKKPAPVSAGKPEDKSLSLAQIAELPQEDQKAYYMKCIKAAGIDIDPAALTEAPVDDSSVPSTDTDKP